MSTGGLTGKNSSARRVRSQLAERLARADGLHSDLARALRKVPREHFLEGAMASHSDADTALPIGHRQTTSQPTVIVRMLDLALRSPRLRGKAIEVGSGCGYVSALLAELYGEVYALERIRVLADLTRSNLRGLGYNNVRVKHADGSAGLKEVGEVDGIIVSAAAQRIPDVLVQQLALGARLVLPLETDRNVARITVVEKDEEGKVRCEAHDPVAFVPLLEGVES